MGNGSESSVPAAYSAKSKAAPVVFLICEGGKGRVRHFSDTARADRWG